VSGLRIGLLVDRADKGYYLAEAVALAGHQVSHSVLLAGPETDALDPNQADAWVVDLSLSQAQVAPQALERLLDQRPLILGDSGDYAPGSDSHQAWLRRILVKLRQLTGDLNLEAAPRAERLWILAASTGGPAAVSDFLSRLPEGLNLALLYIQHIDQSYTDTLIKMMSRGAFHTTLAAEGQVLTPGQLVVVSSRERVKVLGNGTLSFPGEPWAGAYAPSVDQLVAEAAHLYGERLGLIVFSGMGEDGAAASRLVRRYGGQVWAQAPASCVSPSMPEAVLACGTVTTSGTPEELARYLAMSEWDRRRVSSASGSASSSASKATASQATTSERSIYESSRVH